MVSTAQLLDKTFAVVQRFGTNATFTEDIGVEYDPASGIAAPSSVKTHTAMVSPPQDYRKFYKSADSSVQAGTSVITLPAKGLTFTPAIGMKARIAGVDWQIQSVSLEMFQSTVIAYTMSITLG